MSEKVKIVTHSSSLVAKRWQQRSQQHTFAHIKFWQEQQVFLWCTNIPQDPDGILSYVQSVEFSGIRWSKPTLFGRALKCFSKLELLEMINTPLPELEELEGPVPFGC